MKYMHARRARLIALTLSVSISAFAGFAQGWSPLPNPNEDDDGYAYPSDSLFVDGPYYRDALIRHVDLWNGGLDGKSGGGAYLEGFTGYFQVNLDRSWRRKGGEPLSAVALSRAIYINAEAALNARDDAEKKRFAEAAEDGCRFLLDRFRDAELGGFYYSADKSGKPSRTDKQDYANVHPILALSLAYRATGKEEYRAAALEQFAIVKKRFSDPAYPGAIRPAMTRDWKPTGAVNNSDSVCHAFEAMMALYDIAEGKAKAEVRAYLLAQGDFIARRLYRNEAGRTDRGYVAYCYDEDWNPSLKPYSYQTQWSGARHATAGHCVEFAWLLSRAAERGLGEAWLPVAERMIAYCFAYAIEPETGRMQYDIVDYDGKPLPGSAPTYSCEWWPQAETMRALMHWAIVRGKDGYAEPYRRVQRFIHRYFIDHEYGGWFQRLSTSGPEGASFGVMGTDKGSVWKNGYHAAMLYVEARRLAEEYPERVKALSAK